MLFPNRADPVLLSGELRLVLLRLLPMGQAVVVPLDGYWLEPYGAIIRSPICSKFVSLFFEDRTPSMPQ